ncbi:copper resistance system multicopper oxidase [Azospirillum halopraeferens]|uniref:copper resistance system multicopper oxidase n=1 Tax=Azospirillum halopraeferens TaxID=34010 RepID=UPI0003F61E04|nr:copper resistance system multicopper oxidase [Azospirillum halopraeferens]
MHREPHTLSRRAALRLAAAAGLAGVVTAHAGRHAFAAADRALDLAVERTRITIDGETTRAIAIGGSIPAPTLRWREGEEVVVRVTNRLDEPTSIHWHGLLLEGVMDGAPGFNGFAPIMPGETYTYRFVLRQAGTYWYHSHSAGQEQEGMYGAIVIEPAGRDPVRADRDHVVLLSDHTAEAPAAVLRKLRISEGYYNNGRRTLVDFFRDAERDGFSATLRDRLAWGKMRMDATDLADVTGYRFLVNGKGVRDHWTGLFRPGERVRLRIINGSAMSIFDVRIPGLAMTVVAADGQDVMPVRVDEFRIGVGETYDVIVLAREDRAYTVFAEPIDRSGYARATLAPREGMAGEIPEQRPRTVLTMADMGMDHGGMDHGDMDHGGSDHAAMGHGAHGAHGGSAGHADPAPARAVGWADAATPPGAKALAYDDLQSLTRTADLREPAHVIDLRLTGMMSRYVWTLNGRAFDDGEPIRVAYGDRVRIRFINTTMMAHPMHLHGMFMELENGRTGRLPRKHVVLVPPGRTLSVLVTANEPGEWPLHCHLLYHMASGMMARFVVEPRAARL